MPSFLTLNCLILTENPTQDNSFQITISSTSSVDNLKDAIHQRRGENFASSGMTLWKLINPLPTVAGWEDRVKKLDLQLPAAEELMPFDEISEHFPDQPIKKHFHIIVLRPTINLPPARVESVVQRSRYHVVRVDLKNLKKVSFLELDWNRIKLFNIPISSEPAFSHLFIQNFYDMLTKKVTYTQTIGSEYITLLQNRLGPAFDDHFTEVDDDVEATMTEDQAIGYIAATAQQFKDPYFIQREWSALVTETCFAAVVVDPALRTLWKKFNRNTVVTAIPVCNRAGQESIWTARPDFHVYRGSPDVRTLLGESESGGQTESEAVVKMGLMALHAWQLSQTYVLNPEHVILLVYVSHEICTMYLFYKDPEDPEEKFCMQRIFRKDEMFKDASSNVEFLRIMYNFAAHPPHISSTMEPDPDEVHVLTAIAQRNKPTVSKRQSGKQGNKGTKRTKSGNPDADNADGGELDNQEPSGADLAQLSAVGYIVVDDPVLRMPILHMTSNGRDLAAKWIVHEEERELLQFLQSARSDKYRNLAIHVVEFLGQWVVMPYYKDLTTLDKVSPQGYLDIRLQLVEAVAFIHEQGIVHRDLKLSNVLFQSLPDERIMLYVTDFGIAEFFKDGDELVSGFCGTIGCTAPEVDDNGFKYNPRNADVWAIGIIISYYVKFAGFKDTFHKRLLMADPLLRPTAAALFSELKPD